MPRVRGRSVGEGQLGGRGPYQVRVHNVEGFAAGPRFRHRLFVVIDYVQQL